MAPANEELPACLILPALSLPLRRTSLRAAYKPTFEHLLKLLTESASPEHVSRLDVAVILSPSYAVSPSVSRSTVFPEIQKLFEEIYTLICVAAANVKVELDYPGGVDVRIFMLESRTDQLPEQTVGHQPLSGPLVDFHTFLAAQPRYSHWYTVESEIGGQLWNKLTEAWLSIHGTVPAVQRLPCGTALTTSDANSSLPANNINTNATHKSVIVGGTFDHLHIGHKLLLSALVFLASPSPPTSPRKITIGITDSALLANKKHASVLESWSTRQQRTASFIESILVFHPHQHPNHSSLSSASYTRQTEHIDNPGPNGKIVRVTYKYTPESNQPAAAATVVVVDYTQIVDPYGPTITEEDITALVISKETRAGGKAVNDKRREKGWHELEIFEVDVLDAGVSEEDGDDGNDTKIEKETFESKISSTEIRRRLEQRAKEVVNGSSS